MAKRFGMRKSSPFQAARGPGRGGGSQAAKAAPPKKAPPKKKSPPKKKARPPTKHKGAGPPLKVARRGTPRATEPDSQPPQDPQLRQRLHINTKEEDE